MNPCEVVTGTAGEVDSVGIGRSLWACGDRAVPRPLRARDGSGRVPNSEKVKTSCVPGEARASVVSALLAVRRAQTLPTWRVEAAAAELGYR